jgi:hypothetical protein
VLKYKSAKQEERGGVVMGLWEKLWEPIPLYWGNYEDVRGQLVNALEKASRYLEYTEYIVDDQNSEIIANYRGKLDKVVEVLELPNTLKRNYLTVVKIISAVSDLRGDIRANPQRAAKAFGKLFAGVGELAAYLPPPINTYLEIFAEAENFFEDLRVKMQPEIHMRERGLREVIDNL